MPEQVASLLQLIAQCLEIIGAAALILGFLLATIGWMRDWGRQGSSFAGEAYRKALGRTVLIGLEVLVAATIIKTVTIQPSFKEISFLAIMVAIRTTLGWTMVLEMYGHWPWQRPRAKSTAGVNSGDR